MVIIFGMVFVSGIHSKLIWKGGRSLSVSPANYIQTDGTPSEGAD